jgi:glycogen synthase
VIRNTKKGNKDLTRVFVTFESEFAPLGGLAAVMRVLPKRMAEAQKETCLTVAPFFREITKCRPNVYNQIHSTDVRFQIPFGRKSEPCEVFQHQDENGFQTILLDSPHFFKAPCDCEDPPDPNTPCNPYLNPSNPDQLLQDALFFCKAVPEALAGLGHQQNLILYLQDWETASLALTAKENPKIRSVTCVLTLHNSYDKTLSPEALAKISKTRLRGATVLSKMIPLLDGPLSTVSENFAAELVEDPIHSRVYAPHLQKFFKERQIIGINNGLFGNIDFPEKALEGAGQGDFNALRKEKANRRQELIAVLHDYHPKQAWGSLEFKNFEGPIFLFFGRDDPCQKGYDLAAAAISKIPLGRAKFVFTPIPGEEGIEGLEFLRKLAKRRRGEVKVFPFRMKKGYLSLQKGASFLVMCSYYEPFGGATEGYAVGTPVVARATGGLVQQVSPYPSRCLTPEVRRLAEPFHDSFEAPSGFLFREPALKRTDVVTGWRKIIDRGYWPEGDRVADRQGTLLFDGMVDQAAQAMIDAIDVYVHNPGAYARMIFHGFQVLDRFSWDASVKAYQSLANAT